MRLITLSALGVLIAGCDPSNEAASPEPQDPVSRTEPRPPAPAPTPSEPTQAENVLTLEGLDALRIGREVPAGSGWKESEGQIPGPCRTIASPDFPGVYAIVEEGRVRRITISGRSRVTLAQGLGPGASEAEVRAAFPGFSEEPHKYVDRPAKYLTAPDASAGEPALRFEIGTDGEVDLIHVGTMPVLAYVEGCA